MELTIIETSAYQELRKLVSTLAVQMSDFQKQRANPPLERRGKILLPGNGYSGDTGKRTDQKEVKYGGDYHKGFGRVQGTGRMDKKSGESGGRGYGTDTPDSCGRALHDGG